MEHRVTPEDSRGTRQINGEHDGKLLDVIGMTKHGEEEGGAGDVVLRSSVRWAHSAEDIKAEPMAKGLGPRSGDKGDWARQG